MSTPVDRTCTELDSDGYRGIILSEPKPLSAFRQSQAYALLGDAGSGKTTEFKQEAEALGDAAEYLSARQFNRSDVDSHPEWRGKTLFIDGLDEMRAGTTDSLTPLDQIISQLDRLGRPLFRISCREADWLGTNDRKNLATVSPDSQITELRLDPLNDDAIIALLNSLDGSRDAQEFITKAKERGMGAVLRNPQTLTLLAKAVGQGGVWPKSRQETFELACHKMAAEQNEEHLERADHIPSDTAMDAAGYLCALQLLAGTEGYSLTPLLDDLLFPSVDELQEPPDQLSRSSLKRTLGTRLFSGADERRVRPVHRHVAEFLGGRYLAKLTRDGLPASRTMSLMTSPSDQRVATVLRGLSAWLAAHSSTARRKLIEADPIGVGLYGDIGGLTPDEKEQLLESLATFAEQGPLFGHERPDDRSGWHPGSTAQAFRSLASADMADAIRDVLTRPGSGIGEHRIVEFVLEILSEAEESELDRLAELTSDVWAIACDPGRPPDTRGFALETFLHVAPPCNVRTRQLQQLLEEIRSNVLPDPDGQLRGILLNSLYPDPLSPSQVWRYALPFNPHNVRYRLSQFLYEDLIKESSSQQILELLDALHEDASNLIPALSASMADDLPFKLLARALAECGEDVELSRLYNWLGLVAELVERSHWREDHLRPIQEWLNARPQIQKALFLAWLKQDDQERFSMLHNWEFCDVLLGSAPPADFGQWCLDKAVELADSELPAARYFLAESYRSLHNPAINDGLSLELLQARTRGHGDLEQRLEELRTPRTPDPKPTESQQRRQIRIAEQEEEERQRREDWDTQLRSQESELRANRFHPPNLHTLARAYFGELGWADKDANPRQRIGEFIGGDPNLVDAVMVALRDAVWRDDVPDAQETILLSLESKHSWLAYPVITSLDLLSREDPTLLDQLDETQRRNTLATYFCVFSPFANRPNLPTHWFDRWLEQDPESVADVLFKCAHAAMRSGEQILPGLNELERIEGTHPDLAHQLTARLLSSFPVRAPKDQMHLLDRLLDKLLRVDKPDLEQLIDQKLSMNSMSVAQRVRWLVVGALISPEQHQASLDEYACENQTRIQHLTGFLCGRFHNDWFPESPLLKNLSPQAISTLIRLIGSFYDPIDITGMGAVSGGPELDASWRMNDLILLLSSNASREANAALLDLISNPQLVPWRDQLRRAEEQQRILLRDANYSQPSVEQVQRTLDNGLPANAADLAALLNDHLIEAAAYILGDNSNPWQDFWNEGPEPTPRHEESCRDTLIRILRACDLSHKIDLEPERRYPSARRADISAKYGDFNVPVEIKKNPHPDLWDSLHKQLIALYTTDPATSGHGIYLVLWFGAEKTARSPEGHRPATPQELKQVLEQSLTPEQSTKISVTVLDVTKP